MQGYPHNLAPGLHPPSAITPDPRAEPIMPPSRSRTRGAFREAEVSAGRGYRVPHSEPLTAEALYIDDARPPVIATPKPHHVCGICFGIKSHPVSCTIILCPALLVSPLASSDISVGTIIASSAFVFGWSDNGRAPIVHVRRKCAWPPSVTMGRRAASRGTIPFGQTTAACRTRTRDSSSPVPQLL
jgi:hypothetical protein